MGRMTRGMGLALLVVGLTTLPAVAAETAESEEVKDLRQRVEKLEQEKAEAKNQSTQSDVSAGWASTALKGLRIGAYGEMKVRSQDSPNGSETGFDGARVVLLPSYQFTDWLIFNSEIEFEHGGAASSVDGDDKQFEGGNVEVEQAYLEFMVNDYFHWRAPGIDLVPIGYINLHHEPTVFYSTNRPELYQELIPSTWFEGSTSILGKIVDGLNYQFQVSTGLEDNAETQDSGIYAPGVTAEDGIREARPALGEFNTSNNDFGYALRLSYNPPFLPGFGGSTSAYWSRITPRQIQGNPIVTGDREVSIFDTEMRYRAPFGLEVRAETVFILLGNSQNLFANNDGNPLNNVGDLMVGYSGELAYHFNMRPLIKRDMDLVPFYRYTRVNTQAGDYSGIDSHLPDGEFDRQYHVFGMAFFPIPEVVLKLDYSVKVNETFFGADENRLQGAVGFAF